MAKSKNNTQNDDAIMQDDDKVKNDDDQVLDDDVMNDDDDDLSGYTIGDLDSIDTGDKESEEGEVDLEIAKELDPTYSVQDDEGEDFLSDEYFENSGDYEEDYNE